jgi:superfamily II DNA helicase RecQ
MARQHPDSVEALARIPKVGPRKAADFGAPFLNEIVDYLRTAPRRPAKL